MRVGSMNTMNGLDKINVLSLFDGISCARVAIDRIGIKINSYYASEIDKYAIQTNLKNWPNTIQLGDIRTINTPMLLCKGIDLMIGGSPCQDLSIAGKRKGLEGERSSLFWEYVRVLNEVQPRYFILENVNSMPREVKEIITKTLGIEPVMINASLVSAQNRKRLFWIGKRVGNQYKQVEITEPTDKGILLKDILENADTDRLKSYAIDASYYKGANWEQYQQRKRRQLVIGTNRIGDIGSNSQANRVYSPDGKSVALSANGGGQGAKTGLYMIQNPRGKNKGGIKAKDGKTPTLTSNSFEQNNKLSDGFIVRKLTPVECERLMTLPDNYTEGISNTQRYKCLGNGFVVDVIAHILKFLDFTK